MSAQLAVGIEPATLLLLGLGVGDGAKKKIKPNNSFLCMAAGKWYNRGGFGG